MSALVLFDTVGTWLDTHVCESEIRHVLRQHGLDFGRWEQGDGVVATAPLACAPSSPENAGPPQVSLSPAGGDLGAARPWGRPETLRNLPQPFQIESTERLGPHGSAGRWSTLRRRLAREHVLRSPEILHVVEGFGLLYLRHTEGHLGLLCEAQDWVWLAAGTSCKLLLDNAPQLEMLRLLSLPGPWSADNVAEDDDTELPSLDGFVEHLLSLVGQETD